MSTVLALSAPIKTGKSFVGKPFAKKSGWDYVSFGDYVRLITEQRGLPAQREVWQEVGEELIRHDLEAFCRGVLAQAPNWKPGKPLLIDGVRHAEVNYLLREIVAPSKYILAFLRVDEEIRLERLFREEVNEAQAIQRIESHSTENQVKTIFPYIADYIIDGSEPLPILIKKLRIISSDIPYEKNIPSENLKIVSTVNAIHKMSSTEQREILGRLWSEQFSKKSNDVWKSIRFGSSLRVVSYSHEQEQYIEQLKDLLQRGTMARLENESDGTYEIYDTNRTYYVTMTPSREFAALLSSWELSNPPHEIVLSDVK